MKRYFISDTHFFHKNILKYQRNQFQSVSDMHEFIIRKWNSKITKDDLVYVVGDFSFGTKEETQSIINRLNGKKSLVVGNHDKQNRRHISVAQFIEMGFEDVFDERTIRLSNNKEVLLKHYPYQKTGLKWLIQKMRGLGPWKSYYAFYPVDKGLYHIHGHIHGGPKMIGREINVSVETWSYSPVSESQICSLINAREAGLLRNRIAYFFKKIVGLFRSKISR